MSKILEPVVVTVNGPITDTSRIGKIKFVGGYENEPLARSAKRCLLDQIASGNDDPVDPTAEPSTTCTISLGHRAHQDPLPPLVLNQWLELQSWQDMVHVAMCESDEQRRKRLQAEALEQTMPKPPDDGRGCEHYI